MKRNTENPSIQAESRTADFILQLYLILIGIAFGFSIENLLAVDITIPSSSRFLTVIAMLTIWLHGQVGYGLSESYDEGHNWFGRVIENYVEIGGVILIMAAAIVQNKEVVFYNVVLATYAFDLLLEVAYVRRLMNTGEKYRREREVAQSWVKIDLVAVIILSLLLVLRNYWYIFTELPASLSTLFAVLILAFWDYSQNRDFYFGLPRPEASSVAKDAS
jgi:hypothetical protein